MDLLGTYGWLGRATAGFVVKHANWLTPYTTLPFYVTQRILPVRQNGNLLLCTLVSQFIIHEKGWGAP